MRLQKTLCRVTAITLMLVLAMPLNVALAFEPQHLSEKNEVQGVETGLESNMVSTPEETFQQGEAETDCSSEVLPLASGPEPVSALYVRGNIISSVQGNSSIPEIREAVPQLYPSGNSLWFNDGSGVRHVIVTYDNGGAIRHHRDTVEITVRQEGQGTHGGYTYVDGIKRTVPGSGKVLSAYPNKFVQDMTYQFSYRFANPDKPYTIFTVGHLGLTDPHSSTAYTRFETNIYIYWDLSDDDPTPNVYLSQDKAGLSGTNLDTEYRLKSNLLNSCALFAMEPTYPDIAKKETSHYA